MTTHGRERGRESFRHRAWKDAYAGFSAADRESPLEPDDVEQFATAAYLIGNDAEATDLFARAHQQWLERGGIERAAMCGFWLAWGLLGKGQHARSGGWVSRSQRLLDDARLDSVVKGFLLVPAAFQFVLAGDITAAHAACNEAADIGGRFGDKDLVTLSRHFQGRALVRMGRTREGVGLLDEVMVAVTAGDVSPLIVGPIYCSVIDCCYEIFDLRRAQEWTSALAAWCTSQPDLVPYRGNCLVRRAELMQLHGAWPDAMSEAARACEWLSAPPGQTGAGAAYYQRGELHRLRGEFARAEEAYRQASQCGRKPQPGFALLRLAQGQVDAAKAAICGAMDEAQDRARTRMLPAYVEVMLAAGDAELARAGANELMAIAAGNNVPLLRAIASQAEGAVLLAEGDARAALASLQTAASAWRILEAPYEDARVRILTAQACRQLGDEDGAKMELDAARTTLEQLGAVPDLARLRALQRHGAPNAAGGLTSREIEVLRLLATGRTNRAIADELDISEKTVARHISNIFTKLDLSSRAAATAYAFQHDLIPPST